MRADVRECEPWRAQVLHPLHAALASCVGQPHWLLLDPLLGDPLDAIPGLSELARHRLPIRHPDLPPEACPYLIPAPQGRALERLLDACFAHAADECLRPQEGGRARSICALLVSDTPLPALLTAFGEAALVYDAQARRRLFRYWDPRVAQHYLHSEVVRHCFPQPLVADWFCVDSAGELMQLKLSRAQPVETSDGGWRLSVQQAAELLEYSEMNAVLAHVQQQGGCQAGPVAWEGIRAALRASRAAGLIQPDDRIAFAARRFSLGFAIEQAARMQSLLAAVRDMGLAYRALESELDDADWAALVPPS